MIVLHWKRRLDSKIASHHENYSIGTNCWKEEVNFLGVPNHREFRSKEFAIMFSEIGIEFYVGWKNWFREGVVPQNEALQAPSCFVFAWGIVFCLPRPAASLLARFPLAAQGCFSEMGESAPLRLDGGSCVSPGWAEDELPWGLAGCVLAARTSTYALFSDLQQA